MPDPQMRAADTDRDALARRLGEHMAAGRLTVAEYEDRVARTYAAKTYGELAELTADLPSARPAAAAPVARPHTGYQGACGRSWAPGKSWARGARQAAWASWFTTALIVTTIWLITSLSAGSFLYFWPIWVIGPWGAVLLAQTLGGVGRPRTRDRDRHDRRRLGV